MDQLAETPETKTKKQINRQKGKKEISELKDPKSKKKEMPEAHDKKARFGGSPLIISTQSSVLLDEKLMDEFKNIPSPNKSTLQKPKKTNKINLYYKNDKSDHMK